MPRRVNDRLDILGVGVPSRRRELRGASHPRGTARDRGHSARVGPVRRCISSATLSETQMDDLEMNLAVSDNDGPEPVLEPGAPGRMHGLVSPIKRILRMVMLVGFASGVLALLVAATLRERWRKCSG